MNAPAIAIKVREAGPLDVAAISVLHAACFADGLGGEAWNESAIAQIMAMPGTYGLIVTEEAAAGAGEAPAGFALARVAGAECEILSLGVPAPWRRRGLGRVLVKAALAHGHEAGAARAFLEVAEDNSAARALYLAEGFSVVSRRPGHYRRGAALKDALVFARELIP
ncbi:MAG: GNAT family N-acetyltransferase [Kiloniellales bacterium]|jgi:ribosomal-protein-alanine N-acetyltransferase